MGGRAFGPPLCRGCAPATPPYKTIPHRPYAVLPAVRLSQRGGCQPTTSSDYLNGGGVVGLVQTDSAFGRANVANETNLLYAGRIGRGALRELLWRPNSDTYALSPGRQDAQSPE